MLAPNQKGQRKRQGFALDEDSSIGTHLPNFVGFARTASVSTKRGTKGQIEPADERASHTHRERAREQNGGLQSCLCHTLRSTHSQRREKRQKTGAETRWQLADRLDSTLAWGCKIIFSPARPAAGSFGVRKHREPERVGRATPEVRKWPSDGRGRREKLVGGDASAECRHNRGWKRSFPNALDDGHHILRASERAVHLAERALSPDTAC